MIELNNLNKVYPSPNGDVPVLHDINLTVAPGRICGVIGKSGAGKSTLIRCVNLLERPTSGEVRFQGKNLMSLSEPELRAVRRQMGMIFQHFNLLSSRTVYENVALPLEMVRASKKEIRQTVMPLLEMTGLAAHHSVYPSSLSGGQKQRVAIARALALKPAVLLCDEMTSALDPETTRSILQLVQSINQELNLSMLLITHEMDVIKRIADQVVIMDSGRIVEQSDVVSLFKSPQSDVAKRLMETVLTPELPELLSRQLQATPMPDAHTVVRVTFTGHAAAEPIIDGLMKEQAIRINILQANLEYLRNETIGMMVMTIWGDQTASRTALELLQEKGLSTEVLGYVTADDWVLN